MKSVTSFLGKYAAHLAGYAVSAAVVVSGLNPKLLPPQYAFLTGVAGAIVVAAHHGYTAAQGSAAVSAAANAALANLNKAVPAVAPMLAVLLLSMGLGGCATVEGYFASPAAAPIIETVVLVAVGTAEQKGVKATDINRIAKIALQADSGTQATLATVTGAVNAELATLNLPAADLAAANILEAALSAVIQAEAAKNPDVATTEANVATVLSEVIAATGG